MQRFYNEKRDVYGRVEPSATVSVFVSGTATLATIYLASDPLDTPIVATSNPFLTDSNGQFSFAAADGVYDIVVKGSGSNLYLHNLYISSYSAGALPGDAVSKIALANNADNAKGAALVGYSSGLTYPAGTAGRAIADTNAAYIAADTVVTNNYIAADIAVSNAYIAADTVIKNDLADTSVSTKGAALVAFNKSFSYSTSTVPGALASTASGYGAALVGYLSSYPGAVATTVQDKLQQYVSVFDWFTPTQIASVKAGLQSVALGGVDVTAAVQNAINNAPLLPISQPPYGYKVGLYFPPGVYIISSLVMNRWCSIKGAGRFATIISAQNTNPSYQATFYATGLAGNPLEFSDFQIANLISPASVGNGWHLQGCSSVIIHDIWLGGLSNGIWMDTNSTDNDFYNIIMENMQGCGIYQQGGDLNRMNNIEIVQPGDYGIFITTGTATTRMPTGAPFGNVVNGCHIEQCNKHGIYINQGQNNLVTSCNFDNNGLNQSTIWGVYDDIHIVGGINNVIDGNQSSQEVAIGYTLNGIYLDATSSGNVVTGNNLAASVIKPVGAPFTGTASCAGNILNVTNTFGNTIYPGQQVTTLTGSPIILLYGTSGTTGTGGIGTYALSSSPGSVSLASQTFQGGNILVDLGTNNVYAGNFGIPDKSPAFTMATLPTPANGQRIYCSNARMNVGPILRGDGATVAFKSYPDGTVPTGTVLTRWDWQGQQTMYSTSRTNLALQSRTFDNGTWIKFNATVTANATTAPDGTVTAQAILDNVTSISHYVLQNSIAIASSGLAYTFSLDVKVGAQHQFDLTPSGSCFTSGAYSWFDLTTLTIQNVNGSVGTLTPIVGATGWYRATITLTSIASGTTSVYINCRNGGSAVYAGTGTAALYFDNFQVEQSAFATARIITTTAAVSVTDYTISGGTATFAAAPGVGAGVFWAVFGGELMASNGYWRRMSDGSAASA